LQFRHHGAGPGIARRSAGPAGRLTEAWKWLTKCLSRFTQIRPFIDEKLPQSAKVDREIHVELRRYGAFLLTMIKIVLIAAISFATLCQ
jgi:hypothetical protein